MKKTTKTVATLLIIITGLIGVWLSLDKTTRCSFIYGKNICNFYAMIDIASHSPSISDFNKMMSLCSDMHDVPKKDSCFAFVAETFARIDLKKAEEACEEIKEIRDQAGNVVHKKEDCYSKLHQSSS